MQRVARARRGGRGIRYWSPPAHPTPVAQRWQSGTETYKMCEQDAWNPPGIRGSTNGNHARSGCKLLKGLVALTGIECASPQFSSVHLSPSDSKYVQFVRLGLPQTCHRLPRLSLGCHSSGKSSRVYLRRKDGIWRRRFICNMPRYRLGLRTQEICEPAGRSIFDCPRREGHSRHEQAPCRAQARLPQSSDPRPTGRRAPIERCPQFTPPGSSRDPPC